MTLNLDRFDRRPGTRRWGRRARLAALAVLVVGVPGASLAACGGDDEQTEVRGALEQFLADDSRSCAVRTTRFLRNREQEPNREAALRSCREDVRQTYDEPLFDAPEDREISDVEVDRDEASVELNLHGGTLDGQTLVFELAKDGGRWKVDLIDGLEIDDRLRRRLDKVMRRSILEGRDEPSALSSSMGECMLLGLRKSFPNERFADFIGGKLEPGAVDRAARQALAPCPSDGDRAQAVTGSGYQVILPDGWRTLDLGEAGAALDTTVGGEIVAGFRVNANVVVDRDVPQGLSLGRYLERARRGLSKPHPGSERIDFEPLKSTSLAGVDALAHDYVEQGVRVRQVAAMHDGDVYIVTFAAPQKHFRQQRSRLEALLASWTWTSDAPEGIAI